MGLYEDGELPVARAEHEDGCEPKERLAAVLLEEAAAEIIPRLQRKFRRSIRPDEVPGIADLAIASMLQDQDVERMTPEERRKCFYVYCYHAAQSFAGTGWNRQRRLEKSVPDDDLADVASSPPRKRPSAGEKPAKALSRHVKMVRAALDTLPERDRMILEADSCHPEEKLPIADLAAMLGATESTARKARQRARRRFKKEYDRLEAEDRDSDPEV
jgi:DNA-directed RNA polymerase specialized sigma24 family protein